MRLTPIALLLAALPGLSFAAPTWQTISTEPGKRIELDRTTIKREGNIVQAQGRVVLERDLLDARTGASYRVIEAVTRYDCTSRNAKTIKRIYKKNENEIIREEDLKQNELPVRSGTLDDKVLREVCRPPKDGASEVAQKANDAATQLKAANEAMLRQEGTKAAKPEPATKPDATVKASAPPATEEKAAIPSIKPNLKAAAEQQQQAQREAAAAAAATPPTPAPAAAKPTAAPAAASHAAPTPAAASPMRGSTVVVRAPASPAKHASPKPARPAAKDAAHGGYMLEIASPSHAAAEQHAHIHWAYDGAGAPENWSKLDPRNTLCATGQRQSPIDIREGIRVDLEPLKLDYRPSNFRIVDNGHTVQVDVGDSAFTLTGKRYELVQFHFHRPAEERINGQRFEMVAHLVHKADDGQLAVIAVLMERGNEHPFIQTLWNNLPLEKSQRVEPPGLPINPANLLPESKQYYTYMGSLTTPPCTEGVLWIVMKQPIQVSEEQIRIFSRLYRNNARPVQPINDRLIKESR